MKIMVEIDIGEGNRSDKIGSIITELFTRIPFPLKVYHDGTHMKPWEIPSTRKQLVDYDIAHVYPGYINLFAGMSNKLGKNLPPIRFHTVGPAQVLHMAPGSINYWEDLPINAGPCIWKPELANYHGEIPKMWSLSSCCSIYSYDMKSEKLFGVDGWTPAPLEAGQKVVMV